MLTAHLSGVNSQSSAHETMKPTTWRMAAILPLPFPIPFSFSHMKPTPTAHTSSLAPSQKLALTLHPMLHKLANMSLNAEQPGINCPPMRSYPTKPTTWQGINLTPSPSHSVTWSQHLQPILQASIHPTPPPLPYNLYFIHTFLILALTTHYQVPGIIPRNFIAPATSMHTPTKY